MEPEFQVKDNEASAFHLQPPALLLPLSELGLGGLDLLAVPLPLPLPALLLLPVLRLQLVEAGQLLSLQGQITLLLLLQQHVPSVATWLGGTLRQRCPLQLDVTVLPRYDGLRTHSGKGLGKSANILSFCPETIFIIKYSETRTQQVYDQVKESDAAATYTQVFKQMRISENKQSDLPADCRAFWRASPVFHRTRPETQV